MHLTSIVISSRQTFFVIVCLVIYGSTLYLVYPLEVCKRISSASPSWMSMHIFVHANEIPKRYSRNINFIGVHLTILLGDHIILNYRLYHLVENFAHLQWHPYSALCRFLGDHEFIYFLKPVLKHWGNRRISMKREGNNNDLFDHP
jgi:hypothetical protein